MESFGSYNKLAIPILLLFSSYIYISTAAYQAHHVDGNITIKWDVMAWTPDGYVAVVNIYNFQKAHYIRAPGWKLGWTWAKNEFTWTTFGAQATEQGDCSKFRRNIPVSCKKNPTFIDLSASARFNQRIANCCKGGVLSPWKQNHGKAISSFQITVGASGTTNGTVRLPRNITFRAPRLGYYCGLAKIVKPTKFITSDGRRVTQAMMTWTVTCFLRKWIS